MREGNVHVDPEREPATSSLCLLNVPFRTWGSNVYDLRKKRMVMLAWCGCESCLKALLTITRS